MFIPVPILYLDEMGEEIKHSWTCRVCLEPRQIGYRSIHEKYKEYCIMEYINKLTNVNIKSTDGLPDKICNNCFLELEVALSFIEKCEKADNFLKNCYKSSIPPFKSSFHDDVNVKLELDLPVIKSEENVNNEDLHESDDFQYLVEAEQENKDEQENEEEHTKQKTPKSQVECHDCGNLFKSKCKLRVHWKQTHMLDALICAYCKRRFKSYKAMHQHLKNKSQACSAACNPNITIEGEGKLRVFFCKECGYKSRRIKTMEAHLRTHSGERPYHCNLCPRGFAQQSALQAHKEGSHKKYVVQITCQYCGKIVKGRTTVYRHLRRHREGSRSCPICEKPVSCRNLRKHMLRHTGVKTYTCEICGAAFYSSSELANHRRFVHIKSVVYNCELCDYKSIRKEKVKKHQSKHSDKNISCPVCGAFSTTVEKAMAHRRIHYGDKQHECLQCRKKFLKRDSLRRHMLTKHGSVVDHKISIKCKSDQNKIEPIIIETPKTSPS